MTTDITTLTTDISTSYSKMIDDSFISTGLQQYM